MAIPKSSVMNEALLASSQYSIPESMTHIMIPQQKESAANEDIIKIKQYPCLNEWVAILQSVTESKIELTDSDKYKNEGLVIGAGNGILTSEKRLMPQVNVGDRVMFRDRDIAHVIEPESGFYSGKRVILVNERSLIMVLSPVPYEIVE